MGGSIQIGISTHGLMERRRGCSMKKLDNGYELMEKIGGGFEIS